MNKEEQIKKLNNETLFHLRKLFGMWGDIQWSVEDVKDNTLIVRVSSDKIEKDEAKAGEKQFPSKKQIAENIKESIKRAVPEMEVLIIWEKWKPEYGKGFMLSISKKIIQ